MSEPPATGEVVVAATGSRSRLIDRLMGLSDGLFAIAMTLLVLNVEVPDLPEGRTDELAGDLAGLETEISVWLLSFGVLALLWRRQHLVLDGLRTLDGGIVFPTFVLLALVSAVPFSSDLLGSYSSQSIAVAVYAANVGLAVLMLALTAWWGDLRGHRKESEGRWDPLLGFYPSAIFLGSIPVAFISPTAAQLMWLAVLAIVPLRLRRRAAGRNARGSGE